MCLVKHGGDMVWECFYGNETGMLVTMVRIPGKEEASPKNLPCQEEQL